jgi:hypothetical protein
MSVVQASQPNVRFLEVGPVNQRMDPDLIKSLGARYKVETLFTGVYEISSWRHRSGSTRIWRR